MRRPCTYFEIAGDDDIQCYKTDACLVGQSDIFRHCIEYGIPISDKSKIVAYGVFPFSDLANMPGNWVIQDNQDR